jgi:hypothetical protein
MFKNYKTKFILALIGIASFAKAQTCFNTGNGANGVFTASSNTTIAGGSYSFTIFNINAGVLVTVTGTVPLKIYATGAVSINGTLSANGGNGTNGITSFSAGLGGIGIAGGGNGGNGSFSSNTPSLVGSPGTGLGSVNNQGSAWSGGGGAGYATVGFSSGSVGNGLGGPIYGNATLTTLDAGSGGGGGSGGINCGAGGGGAGGGLILINSAVSVSLGAFGVIQVNGGNGGSDGGGNCGGGGGGSGGTIWLASPVVSNNGVIRALGGNGGVSAIPGTPFFGTGAAGANGRIRVDVNGTLTGTGTVQPTVGSTFSISILNASLSNTNTCAGYSTGIAVITPTGGTAPYTYSWTALSGTTNIQTSLSAGNYTCTIKDAALCALTTTIAISSNPLPTVSVNSGTICSGNSFTLIPNGAITYTYSGGSSVVSPTTNTSYSVTGTSSLGCISSNTAVSTVTVNALPAVLATSNTSLICVGQTASLTATGATSYTWTTNATTATITISPTITTSYTVTGVNANGCFNTASITQSVSLCTSIYSEAEILETNIRVYPNPSSGVINVEIEGINDIVQIELVNVIGQVVMKETVSTQHSSLTIYNLNAGIYFINLIKNSNVIATKKVIKN